jgi:hypothetical protein
MEPVVTLTPVTEEEEPMARVQEIGMAEVEVLV